MNHRYIASCVEFEDPGREPLSGARASLEISVEYTDAVNYALYCSGKPIIQRITLSHRLPEPMTGARLEILSDNGLLLPCDRRIDLLPAGELCQLNDIAVQLNGQMLMELTEGMPCTVTIQLKAEGIREVSTSFQLRVLPFDEWQGSGYYPELIAAYETPNHPALVPVLHDAFELLQQWTGNGAGVGYQWGPDRAYKQAAAVYEAIKKQGIVYNMLPPSFERVGQRVRLCDQILRERMANCIEYTLLFCACLEAMGMYPLTVLVEGHAFAGVWLVEKGFPEAATDDKSALEQRLAPALHEIALFECTHAQKGDATSFEEAVRTAERELSEKPFNCVVDIHRARLVGIRPMPVRVTEADGSIRMLSEDEPEAERAPVQPDALPEQVDPSGLRAGTADRMSQWERKLLDLSLRNSLLNLLRMNRSALPVLAPSCRELEAALRRNAEMSAGGKPDEFSPDAESDFLLELEKPARIAPLLADELGHGTVRFAVGESQMEKSLKALYRAARDSQEENGINTLFLAMGLLKWVEPGKREAHCAPILLLPAELVRKSAGKGYALRLRDDPPAVNITLLEKLRKECELEIPGLEPLPLDEDGNVDYHRVFGIVSNVILDRSEWRVYQVAYLANFAYGQFAMWNDLEQRREEIAGNPITASLLQGHLSWEPKPLPELDANMDVLLPLPADASQIRAVQAAMRGDSFVLHGPPGTGKSQTITNMIANLLSQGKRVLFVAEKMAALEVVQRRLNGIGLGAFCLELHSHRGSTGALLDQLRKSLEAGAPGSGAAYAQRRARTGKLAGELDRYARMLHRVRPCGETLYALIERSEQYGDSPKIAPFGAEFLQACTPEARERDLALIQRLIAAGRAVGHPHGHPLAHIRELDYSREMRDALRDQITGHRDALAALRRALQDFSAATGSEMPATRRQEREMALIAGDLRFWSAPAPRAWAEIPDLPVRLTQLLDAANHFVNARAIRQVLEKDWNQEFLKLDGDELYGELSRLRDAPAMMRKMGVASLLRRLRSCTRSLPAPELLWAPINNLRSYQKELRAAEQAMGDRALIAAVCPEGDPIDADWAKIQSLAKAALRQVEVARVVPSASDVRARCAGSAEAVRCAGNLLAAWKEAQDRRAAITGWSGEEDSENLDAAIELCEQQLSQISKLREWASWLEISKEARDAGLGALVDAYEGGLDHDDLLPAYRRALYHGLARMELESEPELKHFSGPQFDETVRQFRELDAGLQRAARDECFRRLAEARAQSGQLSPTDPEYVALNKEFNRNGRGRSIRGILERSPHLLQALCPCMLMSPASVAQYLPGGFGDFDAVIFDEASQLQTCRAVGALSRAKCAIIVGDPKQMPPTTFFASSDSGEEISDLDDLDSVLEDCLALNVPQSYLLWHYRSRHESLIAFSNEQFYEGKLLTFPSANDRESKMRLVEVPDGVFARSGARTNRAEAEAIVEEVKRRCHDPELSRYSVGIVSFNLPQRNLIDDLLSAACRDDPELERWMEDGSEPLFVKNLENVQGDERDVILFSVTYGPDRDGSVYMNFGPLNREGGWRRLNVAATRAREEMLLFATLRPEQINLSRTSAKGVVALRAFLEYAQKRTLSLESFGRNQLRDSIAGAIGAAMHADGWDVTLGVGRSRCRVDVAVVDPEQPGRYLLGVLLDGETYGQPGQTTRDREVAMQDNLRNLGWNLCRVHAPDWWDDPRREIENLQAQLAGLRGGPAEA